MGTKVGHSKLAKRGEREFSKMNDLKTVSASSTDLTLKLS
jgi:hypothetical protein